MKGYCGNIERATLDNTDYRKVVYTGQHSQLVLMCLEAEQEIGMETHPDNDQFLRFESGQGKVVIDDNEFEVSDGMAVLVPAGAKHNVVNTSRHDPLQLYTIYSPAHHKDGIVMPTKQEADASDEAFDGQTTE